MSLLTVLIPNYNNAPFIKEALDSVLNQSYSDFKVLIIDDCSSDNSLEIIEAIPDDRIKIVKKEKNSGIVDALNIGLTLVDTKYVVRMDGDDISYPGRFEALVDFMERNPEFGVCSSWLKTFGSENNDLRTPTEHEELVANLLFSSSVPHAPSIFRTSIFHDNNIEYREIHKYMEDYDLFFRLKGITKFHVLPNFYYGYRILGHNSTVLNKDTAYDRYKEFYKQVLNEMGIDPSEKNLQIHLELGKSEKLSFKSKSYIDYVKLLRSKVLEKEIYNNELAIERIDSKFKNLFYKISDESILDGIRFMFGTGISTTKVKYLFSKILRRK